MFHGFPVLTLIRVLGVLFVCFFVLANIIAVGYVLICLTPNNKFPDSGGWFTIVPPALITETFSKYLLHGFLLFSFISIVK